jgi:hypothetical protein
MARDLVVLVVAAACAILPCMSDQGSDDDQRRDALLLRLLKMPPQSRAETAERVRRAKGKPTRTRGKEVSGNKARPTRASPAPSKS